MFSRAALNVAPACGSLATGSAPVRNMATLKQIGMRLKAVTNIQKITKSMKMVSAAKYARAERELRSARPYGEGALAFFEKAECKQDEKAPTHLIVALTSDRGLCGSVHSNIGRQIKAVMPEKPPGTTTKIICIGDKARAILGRLYKNDILMHFTDIGKTNPTFSDAAVIAENILNCGYEFEYGTFYYNRFKTVVSQITTSFPIYPSKNIAEADKIALYDSIDENVLQSYNEFALASTVFYALKENACSEQSARMTAMDGASKNAGEMIEKLTLTYNRTRQAVITRELIEIISGAAALE